MDQLLAEATDEGAERAASDRATAAAATLSVDIGDGGGGGDAVPPVAPSPALGGDVAVGSPGGIERQDSSSSDLIRLALSDSADAVATLEGQLKAALGAASDAARELGELEEAAVLAAREAYDKGRHEAGAAADAATRRASARRRRPTRSGGSSRRGTADAAAQAVMAVAADERAKRAAEKDAGDAALVVAADAAEAAARAGRGRGGGGGGADALGARHDRR